MQKCKYLDELGLHIYEYGTNAIEDSEAYRKEREEYGFDSRETWDLRIMFLEWIYTRCRMYKETVTVVDLNCHKVEYNGVYMTQEQAIDRILELSQYLLLLDDYDRIYDDDLREICGLWGAVLPHMWW